MRSPRASIPLLRPFMSPEAIQACSETLRGSWIGAGPRVEQFEHLVSETIQNKLFLALNSGTAALNLAYDCAGVEVGAEVITSPLTCLATTVPIVARGGTPVWSDITA